ncbi:lipopolysaccharide assembly protein LapA domain-containing protein [Hwanghaeella sp.]|uniref:lipopolysaccharide assembly protein LapA domain-containing protein n=1 Tax=Hwanghaeella sp. TaxID=2605943 RepID=UPI003CCBFA0E
MRYIYWLFLLILAAPAVVFALSNQETVIVQIWPLPFEIPIVTYLLVFIPFLIGFLVGGIVAWLGAGAGRKRARDARHRAEEAERKVKRLEQELSVARSAQAGSSQANTEQRAIGQQQTLPARIEDDTADKDKDRAAA